MRDVAVPAIVLAVALAAFAGPAAAQFPPPPPPPGSPPPVRDRWPEPPRRTEPAPQQAAPQEAAPSRRPAPPAAREDGDAKPTVKSAASAAAANVVVCGGVFAKDSTHLKLAIKYDSRNVVYGQVDGPDGSKIDATILFPNDPRRRLEVLWNNEASRSDTSVIAINGRSQWLAPKGLKLGMTLAQLEKANGRPFKLGGFGADGTASVAGWENGALAKLPGGCKVGVRLAADPKAPDEARRSAAGDKEFMSNDAALRALKPTVVEVLIGY